jgi:PhnB protein
MLYVDDADATFKQALRTGATELQPLKNQFYGDRSGTLKDPFGHMWTIATHVEDIPPAEMERRLKEQLQKQNA